MAAAAPFNLPSMEAPGNPFGGSSKSRVGPYTFL